MKHTSERPKESERLEPCIDYQVISDGVRRLSIHSGVCHGASALPTAMSCRMTSASGHSPWTKLQGRTATGLQHPGSLRRNSKFSLGIPKFIGVILYSMGILRGARAAQPLEMAISSASIYLHIGAESSTSSSRPLRVGPELRFQSSA